MDSSLCSSKRALIVEAMEKVIYRSFHLTEEQEDAYNAGYLYIHDMGHRRDSINCCLFDMEAVLNGGISFDDKAKQELFIQLEKPYISGITFSGGDPLHEANRDEVEQLIAEKRAKYPKKTYGFIPEQYGRVFICIRFWIILTCL